MLVSFRFFSCCLMSTLLQVFCCSQRAAATLNFLRTRSASNADVERDLKRSRARSDRRRGCFDVNHNRVMRNVKAFFFSSFRLSLTRSNDQPAARRCTQRFAFASARWLAAAFFARLSLLRAASFRPIVSCEGDDGGAYNVRTLPRCRVALESSRIRARAPSTPLFCIRTNAGDGAALQAGD